MNAWTPDSPIGNAKLSASPLILIPLEDDSGVKISYKVPFVPRVVTAVVGRVACHNKGALRET